jgi:P27 family predicted phage terminase small subunit
MILSSKSGKRRWYLAISFGSKVLARSRTEATEAIGKFGVMIKSPNGFPVQSPYLSIANRQTEITMRITSEFGFTPASRGRISTPSSAEPTLFDKHDPLPA